MNPSESRALQARREAIDGAQSVVVKVGTRVLTNSEGKLDRQRIDILAGQLCRIADSGRQVLMVSSGAVGAGVGKLGLSERPKMLSQLQAVAAIGQADLIQAYEGSLSQKGRHAAQVLLTASDLRRRSGYLHVRNALTQIHNFGSIAIINENDSVAVSELMTTFGDNDRLAAQVAGLLRDSLLIILSDVDGLYDGPPSDPKSRRFDLVDVIDESILALAQDLLGSVSKGGMTSKLEAAQIATSHGHQTIIAPGRDDEVLDKIFGYHLVGTLFRSPKRSIRGRRRWIGASARVSGTLRVDGGAARAVCNRGSSLLAVGITAIDGTFGPGSVVVMEDPQGQEIARGLCNYPSSDLQRILGQPSEKISEILGHCPYECVIHRDNMVLTVTPEA